MPRKSRLTLEQIQAQIATLQDKAKALQAVEAQEVLSRIKQAIAHYGFTAKELGIGGTNATSPVAPRRGRTRRTKGVIRFRDDLGNTWTGVGKRPNWYKAAIQSGRTSDDLRVK